MFGSEVIDGYCNIPTTSAVSSLSHDMPHMYLSQRTDHCELFTAGLAVAAVDSRHSAEIGTPTPPTPTVILSQRPPWVSSHTKLDAQE